MSDETVDPQIKKGFNFGYNLEMFCTKENRDSYMKHLEISELYKKDGFVQAAEAGIRQAKKDKFIENFKPRDKDKDHEK